MYNVKLQLVKYALAPNTCCGERSQGERKPTPANTNCRRRINYTQQLKQSTKICCHFAMQLEDFTSAALAPSWIATLHFLVQFPSMHRLLFPSARGAQWISLKPNYLDCNRSESLAINLVMAMLITVFPFSNLTASLLPCPFCKSSLAANGARARVARHFLASSQLFCLIVTKCES